MTLKEKYQKEVIKKMRTEFNYQNDLTVPRIVKVALNVGIGRSKDDPKAAETVENTLIRITGQRPVYTLAKKSISAFKVREGMKVGLKITLRGKRMWDFLEKLVNVSLPRVRDFRGLPVKNVDQNGNLNIGFKEHMVFPEIKSDEVEKIHGLEVAVTTTAKKQDEGFKLLKYLGFPFQES
ncbi:50S ribosomal protein L5 [Patescibacteria group bacterium]|nr:50S ribosomal protein L5 [Patescibacteria group bacterium]